MAIARGWRQNPSLQTRATCQPQCRAGSHLVEPVDPWPWRSRSRSSHATAGCSSPSGSPLQHHARPMARCPPLVAGPAKGAVAVGAQPRADQALVSGARCSVKAYRETQPNTQKRPATLSELVPWLSKPTRAGARENVREASDIKLADQAQGMLTPRPALSLTVCHDLP